MSLALLFPLLALAVGVSLWGLSVFFQGWLYNTRADRLPIRAAVGGLVLGGFLTFWTYVNTRAEFKDKYGTLLTFTTTGESTIQSFTAVRYFPNSKEEGTATFARLPPGRPVLFGEARPNLPPDEAKPYRINDFQYLTTAIVVTEAGKPDVRYETEVADSPRGKVYKDPDKIFREKGGNRFLHGENPDKVSAPSRGAVAGALTLNVLSFVVWFAVLWPILRYGVGHSVGFALVGGVATMVVLMPLLFERLAK